MRFFLLLVLTTAAAATPWDCPECGTVNEGEICVECGLPQAPEGMVYIDRCTVEIDGVTVETGPFFIDSDPVTCREMLDWMSSEVGRLEEISFYIGGQEDLLVPGEALSDEYSGVMFMRYTPWVVYVDQQGSVTGVTVQTGCFDIPAVSLTWEAASLYLNDTGRRLPSQAELLAAHRAGVLSIYDTWESLDAYSGFIQMTLAGVMGVSVAGLSMFADNRSPSDRVMWEWSRDAWGQTPDSLSDLDSEYALVLRPLDTPEAGTALRSIGYYNVIFRGVVPLPWMEE